MSEIAQLPEVSRDENLARFITVEKWVRADNSIRSDAFMPPKDLNLSVTRHLFLSEADLWSVGKKVVDAISEKRLCGLHGRADITVDDVRRQTLTVEADPVVGNPNHAHISGWPDKPAQKNIAQRLAALAIVVPKLQESSEEL